MVHGRRVRTLTGVVFALHASQNQGSVENSESVLLASSESLSPDDCPQQATKTTVQCKCNNLR